MGRTGQALDLLCTCEKVALKDTSPMVVRAEYRWELGFSDSRGLSEAVEGWSGVLSRPRMPRGDWVETVEAGHTEAELAERPSYVKFSGSYKYRIEPLTPTPNLR